MDWKSFYNRVYDVLVEHAGAHEHYREFYVADALREQRPLIEWRFCGKLGFGGKVWRNDGRVYVTCYPEDRTQDRAEIIDRVNSLLSEMTPSGGVWWPPSPPLEGVLPQE